MRVNRNHFGRQTESFQAPLDLPFLGPDEPAFPAVFIRAPVVEKLLPHHEGIQLGEAKLDDTVVAPSRHAESEAALAAMEDHVQVLATLPGTAAKIACESDPEKETGDIIAVKQGNVFGTSFHPELTADARIHLWWLRQVEESVRKRNEKH